MRRRILSVICVAVFSLPACSRLASESPSAPPVRIAVELDDGSRLVGAPDRRILKGHCESIGRVQIDLGKVQSLELDADREIARVLFRNGDLLHAALNEKHLNRLRNGRRSHLEPLSSLNLSEP